MLETYVCTLTREGTPQMNDMIGRSLTRLSDMDVKLLGVHMGKRDSIISRRMIELYDDVIIEDYPKSKNPLKNAEETTRILLSGVKEEFEVARSRNPSAIVYTEGDKWTFMENIPKLALPIINGEADLTIAVRSEEGFSYFPFAQRVMEGYANKKVSKITGIKTDYMYGPRAFSSSTLRWFNNYPSDDWGALTYGVVAPILRGKKMVPVKVTGLPQPDYMKKYDPVMRIPFGHFYWRLMQNLPHLAAATWADVEFDKSSK